MKHGKFDRLAFFSYLGPHCHVLGNPGRKLTFGTCRWALEPGTLVDGR